MGCGGAPVTLTFSKEWTLPGPVMGAFIDAREPYEVLLGPVGSAKTVGAVVKSLTKTLQQKPQRDGVRRRKLCAVRDTYVNLWKSTIPSICAFIPAEGDGITFTGAKGHPATHTIRFGVQGLGKVEFTIDYVAIGDRAAEDALRGYEPTDFDLDEGDRLNRDVPSYALTRVGRFPPPSEVEPYCPAIYIPCNAPIIDTWLYDDIVHKLVEGVNFFRQPPAVLPDGNGGYRVNPAAENLHNVGTAYYQRQIDAFAAGLMDETEFRRMLLTEFGYSRDGKSVYLDEWGKPLFRDGWHVAKEILEPDPRLKLIIGFDGGSTPAAIFRQHAHSGQRRVLDEVVCSHGTDPADFAKQVNIKLSERFRKFAKEDIVCGGDPATFHGDKYLADERVFAKVFERESGLRVQPAGPPSNSFQLRRQAMTRTFKGHIAGGQPMFLLSPVCRRYRKALNGGYVFNRVLVAAGVGATKWRDEPDKGPDSHIAEADQYGELIGGGYDDIVRRTSAADFNPLLQRNPAARPGFGANGVRNSGDRDGFAPQGELMCELGE